MPPLPGNPRHIVFVGESGAGKSSAINLLLETGTFAPVSNDRDPCTQAGTGYETTLNGVKYTLWDTRGLGNGRGLFRNVFGIATSSENELKSFLRERHRRREIDLLVYCVRGSRATKASVKYYNDFCVVTRQLAAPVVLLVTQLEREPTNMEEWWNRNFPALERLEMEFDGYACITTLPRHSRIAESRERLVDLITRNHHWHARHSGSYFGSPVRTFVPSAPAPRRGLLGSLFNGGARDHSPSNDQFSGAAALTRSSSYYTAESPGSSMPPSPVLEPPTPSGSIAIQIPPIDINLPRVDRPSQASGEDTSSVGSPLHSLFTGSHGSAASHMEVPLELLTDDAEDQLISELPLRHSVVRRKSYAIRHGPFGDIWECDLISEESSRTLVAVKVFKLATNDLDKLRSHKKKLNVELRVLVRLRHRNIVPLLGIVSDFGPLPSTVSPWFHNESLSHYLDGHLSLSDKHSLLGDIAAGLCYLHSNGITHGDMHSDNVLIDADGRACLTDFGLSLIIEFVDTSYLRSSFCGPVQFADPVLVQQVHESNNHIDFPPKKPFDIYSFGGLLLHVLSEKKPYDGLSPPNIFLKVLRGERPTIPTQNKHVALHKSLIQRCWDRDEHKRPLADNLTAMFVADSTKRAEQARRHPRHIIFFGETGVGKSSAINLLLETGTSAPVSNDGEPCTQVAAGYETTLNGVKYTLWDTRGLGEGRNSFRNIFGIAMSPENELKKFLRERHQRHEIDLVVYCIRGSTAIKASAKYYNDFCVTTRQLAAPVVILVTQLEREPMDMEEWWNRNSPGLERLKMEFDGHACIMTLPEHHRIAESRERLVDLITRRRRWQLQRNGSYFGSLVSTPIHSPPSTPSSATAELTQIPPINTDLPGFDRQSQASGEETSSLGSSQHPLFTGAASHMEVPLELLTDDAEDHSISEIPFRRSVTSTVRSKNYPTRHGPFGDIRECDLISGELSRTVVAVKVVKLGAGNQGNLRSKEKILRRELRIWGRLHHQNIVPLLGIVSDFGPLPSTVSPWFHNGSLSHYLDGHLSLLEKHSLLGDIATGLSYLHSNGITHGDMHSDNVLIDDDGRACLMDFGLSLFSEFVRASYLTSSMCDAVLFADPALFRHVYELHDDQVISHPTKPCDVYSFGGLLLHVLSEKKPYDGLSHTDIFLEVSKGGRPRIPMHDEHVVYKPLIQMCWDRDEHKRPSADDLVTIFAQHTTKNARFSYNYMIGFRTE